MLFIGSLAAVAVPKLAGQLVDVCINVQKGSGPKDAKHQLDSERPSLACCHSRRHF